MKTINQPILSLLICILFVYTSIKSIGQTTVNFGYTGGAQTWVVPPCVTSINVTVAGAQGGGAPAGTDRKSTRLNSSHIQKSRMPSSA